MPTKISIIYDNPTDAAAFEAGYAEQVSLAKALPGLVKIETSKCWPHENGDPTPLYRMVDLYFVTPAAGALFPSVFGLGAAGVKIAFMDVEEG